MALSESPAIEDLRLFISLAETGNVTQTAKRFGVRQPSVTKRLKVFQGKHALLTSESKVELTAKGQMVLPAIRHLVRQYDQLKKCIAEKRDASRILSVATGSSASQHYLPFAIAQMKKRVPDLEIEVQATRGAERIVGVVSGRFDLAIVSHDRLQIDLARPDQRGQPDRDERRDGLVVEELAVQSLCVIAAKTSSDAEQLSAVLAGQEVPLDMLGRLPLIGLDRNSGIRRQLERAFVSRGEGLRFGLNAAGWWAVKEYARYGLGVGIVPMAILSNDDVSALTVRRLPAELCIRHLMIHREDADNRHLDEMKAALKNAATEHLELIDRCWGQVT